MPWDDELKGLVIYVIDHFGESAFFDANKRATNLAISRRREAAAVSPAEPAEDPIVPAGGETFSLDVFYEALRDELRRIGRPR